MQGIHPTENSSTDFCLTFQETGIPATTERIGPWFYGDFACAFHTFYFLCVGIS